MPKPDNTDLRRSRNLWGAVLLRAILDYVAGIDAKNVLASGRYLSDNQRMLSERKKNEYWSIRWWAFNDNYSEINDFLMICDLLKIDSADIRAKLNSISRETQCQKTNLRNGTLKSAASRFTAATMK